MSNPAEPPLVVPPLAPAAPAPPAPLDPLVPPVLAKLLERDAGLEELQAPAIAAAHSQTPPSNRSQKTGDALMGIPFAPHRSMPRGSILTRGPKKIETAMHPCARSVQNSLDSRADPRGF
jgi:hypothetical protein